MPVICHRKSQYDVQNQCSEVSCLQLQSIATVARCVKVQDDKQSDILAMDDCIVSSNTMHKKRQSQGFAMFPFMLLMTEKSLSVYMF